MALCCSAAAPTNQRKKPARFGNNAHYYDDAKLPEELNPNQSPIPLFTRSNQQYYSQNNLYKPPSGEKGAVVWTEFDDAVREYPVSSTVAIKMGDLKFTLAEFHFHTPGEYVVDGERGVLELHLVFVSNPDAKLLVVAKLVQLGKHTSRLLRDIMSGTPFQVPTFNRYWTFTGSLTNNDVALQTKAINWIVSADPLCVTQNDLDGYFAPRSKPSRALNPVNGRVVVCVQCACV